MIRALMATLLLFFVLSCSKQTRTVSDTDEQPELTTTEIAPEVRETAENFVSEGVAYYQDGNYEKAVSSWKEALELIPGDAEVHNFIGISYHNLNRLDDATHHFVMATKLDTTYYEAYNNLGYDLFLQKKYGEARRAFETALDINPQYTAAKLNYERTKKIMSGALKREVFELTEQAAKIDDVDQQISFYEKILMIDSLNAEVHNNLAVAYYYADSLDGAYDHLNIALKINKDYPEAINNMGYIYKVAGRYQEAVNLFLKAISLKPKYVFGLNNLGETYMLMNENENAVRVFHTVLEIDPENEVAKDGLAKLETK
jgi:Flp pilus assembly protein TadD